MSPRRFHALGLGAPRSGTMSLAGLFSENYKSAHEAERGELWPLLQARMKGELGDDALALELIKRDMRLLLEFEASCFISDFPKVLATVFPEARFIVTVRDCTTWLTSMVEKTFTATRARRPTIAIWHDFFFRPMNYTYSVHDGPLEARQLYPLAAYLDYYSRTYQRLLNELPQGRTLYLSLSDQQDRARRVESFLSLTSGSLIDKAEQRNATVGEERIVTLLDPAYVDDEIESRCGPQLIALKRAVSES